MLLRTISLSLLLLCALAALAAPAKLDPANLTLQVYQRIFPPRKPPTLTLELYNLRSVTLRIYPTDIESLIPNAAVLETSNDRKNPNSVVGRLARMSLSRPVKTLTVTVKKYYPNQWTYPPFKLPKLPSGVYVVEASGGGVTKRTWLAVSSDALLVKRSPDVVTAWLVNATSGKPIAGVPLALYDAKGKTQTARTGADGLATFKTPTAHGPLWVAAREHEPAFARASSPPEEKPYQVYLYTDRPIYRPGQVVHFRGTVRAVTRGEYSLPKNKEVRVQIKTRGDTVVYDERLPLNDWGSFSGDFSLAQEPPLGAYSLEMAIGEFREYAGFEVEAYRKPDFQVAVDMPAKHAVGGGTFPVTISATYFFGSPVAKGQVEYTVEFEQAGGGFIPPQVFTAAGLGSAAMRRVEDSFRGEGQLDADGKLVIQVPTERVPYNRQLTVQAKVTDLSLRTRSAAGGMLLTSGAFQLALKPDRSRYLPGQTAKVQVIATDYDDKPVSTAVTVTIIEGLRDREGRYYEERTKRTVTTDREGRGTVSFKLTRPGEYRLEAWALDAEKNPVFTAGELYASEEKRQEWPTLEMTLDRRTYAPGDTAKLRIRTTKLGASALLTVEGERLYLTRVIPLAKKEFAIMLPVTREYLRGVTLRLTAITDGDTYSAYAQLNIPRTDRKLTVAITPDKATYQPGDTATYTVTTKDAQGKPAPAEVGLGVVDTALYAIRSDSAADPYAAFWYQQYNRVETDFSLSATYPGGAFQHIPQQPTEGTRADGGNIRVRKQFEDTAYWTASVQTGPDGTATVSFTMPDNLTTWRATARALTRETSAGQGKNDTAARLPLMARLVLPRFYIKGDQAIAAALVHNYTGTERDVRVTLTAEGAQVQDEPSRTIRIPSGGIARVTWKVAVAGRTGNPEEDSVRFLVSADGGPGASDAMQSSVPVHPNGVRRVVANAGMLQSAPGGIGMTTNLSVPQYAVPGSATLEVTLSPSLAGPILEALDYLVGYPYGCAEQTMDQFLPDIIVTRALKELGADRPTPKMLPRFINFGIQKLLRYQHEDGGWQWWEFDESDPYMTAYVVYGLAMARDAGYPLAAGPLPRGVNYLTESIEYEQVAQGEIQPAEAAYLLWALAYADVWNDRTLKNAYAVAQALTEERGKLDTFSRASLALALDRLSMEKDAPKEFAQVAGELAAGLEKDAVDTGIACHWTARAGGDGSWLDSDVEVTSQVLPALLALRPSSPRIVPAVRWLMAARRGKAWNSTKDTAAAVFALTAYLEKAKEVEPNEQVTVRVNGKDAWKGTLGKGQVFADPVKVTIPTASLAPGDNSLELAYTGPGNLYWTAHLGYIIPVEKTAPLARGISLVRHFQVTADDPVNAGVQPTGNMIRVTVEVNADQPYRYALLSEPIPAGCEVITAEDDDRGFADCDYREVWDNRILFFLDYLPKGESTFTYWLQTESPGAFNIPPSTAELMYFPEVRGDGPAAHLNVVESKD